MPDPPLLIYHHLPKSGGTSLRAVVLDNYGPGEVAEIYGGADRAYREGLEAGKPTDFTDWYRDWYESLPDEERSKLKCVASHGANRLMPALERPFRAFSLLRDPAERVWSLYHFLRQFGRVDRDAGRGTEIGREILDREWGLTDIYLNIGGKGPGDSKLDGMFRGFFNGQARNILAPWGDESRMRYWAGTPHRGYDLRDEALEILNRHYVVGVHEHFDRSLERFAAAFGWNRLRVPQLNRSRPRSQLDPETRALILEHNQIDAELHAHFCAVVERDRPRRRALRTSSGAAVCVLGMSRSGTSLTTRILNVLGVELGSDEELMPPAGANNSTGFWEHKGIADLNEDILATLGDAPRQRWRFPPRLPEGWEQDPRLDSHRAAARSMLRESFTGLPLWGWKDPRTCLTLPFWQDLLPRQRGLEARLRYVICVRHPLDVAASLEARDDVGREEALELWLRYMSDAILHTSGCPRIFVSYESYFPAWENQARRLAEFLGLPALTEEQRSAISDHLDEGLWHHRQAERAASGPDSLPVEVDDLYMRLVELCDPDLEAAADAEAGLDAAARRVATNLAQT